MEIYCALEAKVPEEVYNNTFAQRVGEVEHTFDDCKKKTADAIAKADNARMETEDLLNQTLAASGPAPAGGAAKYKLEPSFEPQPKLSPEFNAGEFHVWQEQWTTYYDISGLQNVNAKIQKAALINYLSTEFRTKLDFSHVPDGKEGLEMIRKDFVQRNPVRHNLFKVKQRKGESYSDMRVRMKTLQKEADIDDITADDLVCHIMLAACNDSDLLQELMKVENMTEVKLNKVVDKYETLMAATKGLNKSNKDKEEAKVVKGERKNMTCYRCQAQGHRAEQCKVQASKLKCTTCNTVGKHNTHPYCRGPKKEKPKKEKAKQEKEEKKEEEKGNRVVADEGDSPAGDEDSSSGEEYGFTRQTR